MAELLFQSNQEKLNDGTIVIVTKIIGAIDGTTVRQFEEKLIGFFNRGVKNLILIFSEVKYINSTGMGLLVKLADKFQEGGGDIKLVGVPEKVIALFDMLGLLSLFKIYDTERDALDAINQGSTSKQPEPEPEQVQEPPTSNTSAEEAIPETEQAGGDDDVFVIDPSEEDEAEEAPAPKQPVAWPHETTCGHCSGPLNFAAKGTYQCPRCKSYISIDEFGQQAVTAVKSKMVDLKCPSDMKYVGAVKGMINSLAGQVGFSNVFCEEINAALDAALAITVEKRSSDAETFEVIAVADSNEMVMGIKALNPFLAKGAPRDRRLPMIAKKVDKLEVFPLPNRGQLLKITKKRK